MSFLIYEEVTIFFYLESQSYDLGSRKKLKLLRVQGWCRASLQWCLVKKLKTIWRITGVDILGSEPIRAGSCSSRPCWYYCGDSSWGIFHLGLLFINFCIFSFDVKETSRMYPRKLSWIALRVCSLPFSVALRRTTLLEGTSSDQRIQKPGYG